MLRNLPLGIPSLAFIGLLLFRSCAPMILPNESARPVSLSGRPDLYCWNRQLGISSDSPVCVGVHICVCMRHPIPESVQTEAVLLLSSLNTGTKRLSLCSRLTLPLCHPRCRAAPSGNARQCNFKKKKKDLAIVRMWNGKCIFLCVQKRMPCCWEEGWSAKCLFLVCIWSCITWTLLPNVPDESLPCLYLKELVYKNKVYSLEILINDVRTLHFPKVLIILSASVHVEDECNLAWIPVQMTFRSWKNKKALTLHKWYECIDLYVLNKGTALKIYCTFYCHHIQEKSKDWHSGKDTDAAWLSDLWRI